MKQFLMGVINLTPNSFSDGGCFNQSDSFEKHFCSLLKTASIIDLGAESTAPFNDPISIDEELKRYEEVFFPLLRTLPDPKSIISIDTYKVSVFKAVASKIKKSWPKTKIIFNDVSGSLDNELIDLLKDDSLDFSYVYSHNLAPNRGQTSHHMNYCLKVGNESLLKEIKNYFKNGLSKLKEIKREIIIDPCFGFSKTREQNHYLLSHMKEFLSAFDEEQPLLYGISRKSFLRLPPDMDIRDSENIKVLDHMQTLLMDEIIKYNPDRKIIFRCHNDTSLKAIQNKKNIFDLNS